MESGEFTGYAGIENAGNEQSGTEWKKIIDHPDLEIYWPSKTTVVGFLVACAFVALIIGGTMLLARIGA